MRHVRLHPSLASINPPPSPRPCHPLPAFETPVHVRPDSARKVDWEPLNQWSDHVNKICISNVLLDFMIETETCSQQMASAKSKAQSEMRVTI